MQERGTIWRRAVAVSTMVARLAREDVEKRLYELRDVRTARACFGTLVFSHAYRWLIGLIGV